MALTRWQLVVALGREVRRSILPSTLHTTTAVLLVWFFQGGRNFWNREVLFYAVPIGGFAGLAGAIASWGLLVLNEILERRNRIPLRLSSGQHTGLSYAAALAGAFLGYGFASVLFLGRSFSASYSNAAIPLGIITLVITAGNVYALYRMQVATLRKRADEASFQALKQQVQPHFLFNALNAISELVEIEPAQAGEGLRKLSMLYRGILEAQKHRTWPLANELDVVRALLHIESLRFGKRLRSSIVVPDDCLQAHVPPLILQTLVENAIKHGIASLRQGGLIEVRVSNRSPEGILVEVVNPVQVESERAAAARPPGTKTGLSNARARLALLYGNSENLSFAVEAGTARASFTVNGVPLDVNEEQRESHFGR